MSRYSVKIHIKKILTNAVRLCNLFITCNLWDLEWVCFGMVVDMHGSQAALLCSSNAETAQIWASLRTGLESLNASAEAGHPTSYFLQLCSPLYPPCNNDMRALVLIVLQPMGMIQKTFGMCMHMCMDSTHVAWMSFASNPGLHSITKWGGRHLAGQPIRVQRFGFMPGILGVQCLNVVGQRLFLQHQINIFVRQDALHTIRVYLWPANPGKR